MPVEITVRVYTTLPEKLGWRVKKLVFDKEPSIKDVLENLPDLARAIEEYKEKGYAPIIMINGRRIEFLNGLNTLLKNRCEIDIFPPSAGG